MIEYYYQGSFTHHPMEGTTMPSNEENEAEKLLTPMEWVDILEPGAAIIDLDGWRKGSYPKSFAEPILKNEFQSRLNRCNVLYPWNLEACNERARHTTSVRIARRWRALFMQEASIDIL